MSVAEMEAVPYTPPASRAQNGYRSTGYFVAVDGEGMSDAEGAHHYILLAASNGTALHNGGKPIGTWECLNYLCDLPERDIKVGFAFSYDVNMILRDMPRYILELLHQGKTVQFQGFRIHYLPRRRFTIYHVQSGRRCVIYDVFGFFQSSFVSTLDTWNIGTPEERERIAKMKEQRGSFRADQMAEITAYCLDECRLLVATMDRLKRALEGVGLSIKTWWGAGAVAAAILSKEGAKAYIPEQRPAHITRALLCAYFGGRFETISTGHFPEIWSYDIRSAYPTVMQRLPCMKHGRWRKQRQYEPGNVALWEVEWDIDPRWMWTPFPVRRPDQRIYYPFKGKGILWGSEVDAAVRLFNRLQSGSIRVAGGYVWHQECDHTPFAWIAEYYQRRMEYRKAGLEEQMPLKLGLNSLYGKMAQSIGYQGKRPTFQSWEYAGQITAGTRAVILGALEKNYDANGRLDTVLSIATDGIVSQTPIPGLPEGEWLGQWEAGKSTDFWIFQGGVYRYTNAKGESVEKTRGFMRAEVDWAEMQRLWLSHRPFTLAEVRRLYDAKPPEWVYPYKATRFLTLGAALMLSEDFRNKWGRWLEMDRHIDFMPETRKPIPDPRDHMLSRLPLYPLSMRDDPIIPFEPKQTWDDVWLPEKQGAIWTLIDLEQP
jgi:hypothetical protein